MNIPVRCTLHWTIPVVGMHSRLWVAFWLVIFGIIPCKVHYVLSSNVILLTNCWYCTWLPCHFAYKLLNTVLGFHVILLTNCWILCLAYKYRNTFSTEYIKNVRNTFSLQIAVYCTWLPYHFPYKLLTLYLAPTSFSLQIADTVLGFHIIFLTNCWYCTWLPYHFP